MTWTPIGEVGHTIITDARRRLDEGDKAKTQADLEWLTIEEKAIMFGEFRGYAKEKGKSEKWVLAQYRARFGEWPGRNVEATPALDCGPETRAWIDWRNRDFWRTQKRRTHKRRKP